MLPELLLKLVLLSFVLIHSWPIADSLLLEFCEYMHCMHSAITRCCNAYPKAVFETNRLLCTCFVLLASKVTGHLERAACIYVQCVTLKLAYVLQYTEKYGMSLSYASYFISWGKLRVLRGGLP